MILHLLHKLIIFLVAHVFADVCLSFMADNFPFFQGFLEGPVHPLQFAQRKLTEIDREFFVGFIGGSFKDTSSYWTIFVIVVDGSIENHITCQFSIFKSRITEVFDANS